MPRHFPPPFTPNRGAEWLRRLLHICYSKKMCGLLYNHVFLSCLLYFSLKIFIFLNKQLILCIGKITYALDLWGVCCRHHPPHFLCPAFCWPMRRYIPGLQGSECPTVKMLWLRWRHDVGWGKFPRVRTQPVTKGKLEEAVASACKRLATQSLWE